MVIALKRIREISRKNVKWIIIALLILYYVIARYVSEEKLLLLLLVLGITVGRLAIKMDSVFIKESAFLIYLFGFITIFIFQAVKYAVFIPALTVIIGFASQYAIDVFPKKFDKKQC